MITRKQTLAIFAVVFVALALRALAAKADDQEPAGGQAVIDLARPEQHEFIKDEAQLLTQQDADEVKRLGEALMKDEAVPIIVVTIKSMADHSAFRLRIETFARLLFDQWQIGSAELDGREWNRGILLLVSKKDRKARIELGNGWRREKDPQCQRIMQAVIIPHFKRNDYSGGILAGVKGLDDMARGRAHPGQAGLPGAGDVRNGRPAPAPVVINPAPQNVTQNRPPNFPQHWQPPTVRQPVAANGLPVAFLMFLGVVIVVIFGSLFRGAARVSRNGLRGRQVSNNSFWGGPMGWQNWWLYEMSRQNWDQQQNAMHHHTSSGFSGGISDSFSHSGGGFSPGGGFDAGGSSGNFDSGSSGGGGATGSW